MDSQPMRAISIVIAILTVTSCSNSGDKTQPSEALASSKTSEQYRYGEPLPEGRIRAASNFSIAVDFRSVPLTGKAAKSEPGHSQKITKYPLLELPKPPVNEIVHPSNDPYPTLSFLRRAFIRFEANHQYSE